jgi:Family of unknown function (DUF5372)
VTIIRPRHPFEGKLLELLRTMHRKGRLYLILILPDGTKSLIPADWTDFVVVTCPGPKLSACAGGKLGSIEDLLHTCAVTDALLNRLAAITREAEEESPLARKPSESLRSASRQKLSVGSPAGRATASGNRHPGKADPQQKMSPGIVGKRLRVPTHGIYGAIAHPYVHAS